MSLDVSTVALRTLRAVVDSGSFTAAAERLGFTQSAVSKQIGALESLAGTRLFERGARGASPTPACRLLAARAVTIIDQLDAAERELHAAGDPLVGRVALGAFPTAAVRLVPDALARLSRDHPALTVEFAEASTPVQLRRLRSGRIDLAVVAGGEGLPAWDLTGVDVETLPSGPLLVAVAESHRLARAGRAPVADLADEQWIAGKELAGEPQFGVWPTLTDARVVAHLGDWTMRLGFVAAGLGITSIPSLAASALPPGVVTVAIDDPSWGGRSMMLARIGTLSPPARAVRAAVVAAAAHLVDPSSR